MITFVTMKDRIIRFLKSENLSAAQFADEIGVQRSGISHILSGRNNPSLDFIQRMLKRFPNLNPDWILLNKGSIYRSQHSVDAPIKTSVIEEIKPNENELLLDFTGSNPPVEQGQPLETPKNLNQNSNISTYMSDNIDKIILFYDDGSCKIYKNRK